ncbi:MAG: hypothetical protein J0G97_17235 [Rhizobium pusense]|nr:hypothetical protein [Agrobacterium pusense]
MIALLLLCVALIGAMCAFAYTLATYALLFLVAVETARFACTTGAGLIGAGVIGLFTGILFFGLMACLFATLRSPVLRLAVALIFAVPPAIAGYALVRGIAREAVPSDVWRHIFSIAGGACTGLLALARLANPSIFDVR